MKNFLFPWYRNLTALENTPAEQSFSVADPTNTDPKGLSTVTLSVAPSDGQSPTMVSLRFEASGVKLFEKKYQDDQSAQAELSSMAKDLSEAAELSKSGKTDEAKNLMSSLITKYKRASDTIVQPSPTTTMTQASQEVPLQYKGFKIEQLSDGRWQASQDVLAFRGDSIDTVKAKVDNMLRKAYGKKLAKRAGITMQNLFFDTVDEAMDYQEKMKALQPEEGAPAEGQPLWDQMQEQKEAPLPEGATDESLAPSNLAPDFKQIEKDKAKQDKDIGKRIKEQVKTEVESALEQKSASVFGKDQEALVDALRKNGRNWDEIKKIFVKELSYNEDDTTVFLDSIRQKEEGGPASEGLPLPPKPPEDLVSPETHDKLVKEIEDKEPKLEPELKPEPKPLEDEIARADNSEIRKVALNPLQEPPTIGQTPGQPLSAPIEEAPTMDAPPAEEPVQDVEPELLEAPEQGDRVYVMGDYETGQDGYEGTLDGKFSSKGNEYATVLKDDGSSEEVMMHRVVKASQKKVDKAFYEKKADYIYCSNPDCKRKATRRLPEGNYCEKHAPTKKEAKHEHVFEKKPSGIEVCPCGRFRFPEAYIKEHGGPIVEQKEADLDVESKSNEDVIRMFVDNSFPKDKMPVWGTANLKITKYPNGWALVNYQTPILYRANGEEGIYFNTQKYSVTTSKIQTYIRRNLTGKPVKEVDEAGIRQTIESAPVAVDQDIYTEPTLESLHESALKLQADLEHVGKIAFYFTKEGIEKTASDDSAFEANGWCRVWVDDIEIESDAKYSEILKLPDENTRIKALKELARDIAHEALRDADNAAGKFGVQAWFELLQPSDHDRIDWVALANPKSEEQEMEEFNKEMGYESSQTPKIEKKADHLEDITHHEEEGLSEEDEIAMFQRMINDGSVWHMQGSYGRRAMDLLRSGLCELGEKSFTDAYGNKVPSKHEVMPGTTGAPLETRKFASQQKKADPQPEAPKEVPVTYKELKIAPKHTDREKALPATEQQAEAAKKLESSLSSIEAIKTTVKQVKLELDKKIQEIQEAGGLSKLEEEKKKEIDQLSALVNATENKLIAYGNSLYGYSEVTEKVGPKITDAWRVEKLLKKFSGAEEYLKQAEAGAQSMAEEVTTKTLTKFPKLSKLDKSADFLDNLTEVYNNVLEALKSLVNEEEPARA
jgi:hypothetical protein